MNASRMYNPPMQITREENEAYRKFVSDLATELGVFDLKGIETVWHYTDGSGFLGILQSGRLYATQVSALNDSKETEYATDLFRDEVKKAIVEQSANGAAVSFFQNILEEVKDEPGNPTQGISKFFVACFSTRADDLNQWSKYTKTSPGRFAIAFHPNGLNREPNSTLYRVIYDRAKLEAAIKKVVYATLNFYMSGLIDERADKPEEWARLFYLAWDEWIYKLAPLAKDQQWDSEDELRIVHELRVSDFPDVRFTQKKSSLARYLPLDFPCWVKERVSRLPIAKVMVGPGENQASSRVSAILLLQQMGYPDVPVEMSKCTLVER
jgi:hypothetical protein